MTTAKRRPKRYIPVLNPTGRKYTNGEIYRNRAIVGGVYAGAAYLALRTPRGKRLIAKGKRVAARGLRLVSRVRRHGISKAVKGVGRYKRAMGVKLSYRGSALKIPARRFSSTVNGAKRGTKMYTRGFQTFTASPVTTKGKKRIAGNLRRYGRKRGWSIVRKRGGAK